MQSTKDTVERIRQKVEALRAEKERQKAEKEAKAAKAAKSKTTKQNKQTTKQSKQSTKQTKQTTKQSKPVKQAPRGNRAKLLVSIVNRSDETKLKSVLDDVSVGLSVAFAGTGTARSAVLDYFGIGETEKTIVFSLFPESDEDLLVKEIRSKMSLHLVGRGISFTIPLTGVSEIVANGLSRASAKKNVVESLIMNDEKRKYDLIVCAVNAEYSDKAMEAARLAGAAGGTILHARMLDNKKAQQFIGISLAREQEILLILTKREGKMNIMKELFASVGVKTEAAGIIFSLPVDRTMGIGGEEVAEAAEENKAEPKAEPKKDE